MIPRLDSVGRTLTVRVPIALRKRGGRKLVIAPEGVTWSPPPPRVDNTLINALARAHRWKSMLASGRFDSVGELAKAEKINKTYVCRILRLTLLASDIVEAILDGRQPATLLLAELLAPFPVWWEAQRAQFMRV